MTNPFDTFLRRRRALIEAGAYDSASEHDACGVGRVAAIDGRARRDVVDMALAAM